MQSGNGIEAVLGDVIQEPWFLYLVVWPSSGCYTVRMVHGQVPFPASRRWQSWRQSHCLPLMALLTFQGSELGHMTPQDSPGNLLLFSHSVMSDSLQPQGLQHTRLPCPSLSPRVCSNSCPLSRWCHPPISSSVAPFSSCPQSFLDSRSFLMNQLFTSSGQSIGASTSTSVLPMNIQYWFLLGLPGLIPLLSKGISTVFSSITVWKHQFFSTQLTTLWSNSHICTWLLEKNHSFNYSLCWQSEVSAF